MIREIILANIGYNSWNGFYITIVGLEIGNFSGELFGLDITPDIIIFSILFFEFEINLKK